LVYTALIVGYKAIGYSRARTTMTRLLTQLVNKHLLVKDKDQGYIFPKKEQGGDSSTPTTKKD
jgi:predicted transcriptional regulator